MTCNNDFLSDLNKSDNVDLAIIKMVSENLSVVICNVYATNDHNEEYMSLI